MAGYLRALGDGLVDAKDRVVLIATGHALKDPPDILLMGNNGNVISISSMDELRALIISGNLKDNANSIINKN